ncbi:MAG: undecaprenyldiphospho-muramoylpentapeptide beta-N-acetylglucosaminyltransferase [Oscillospiraceae bacterium]|jgi:UDP-N-acetylglucosamine--N-acetylmuramyl-(pentapeptide) pyrophosphoryl-undecaprenol N-acetylglucosamine transferase|nr:undecaprenyldiphospho-muramoylpentapeptide beta-N-acetylglucosaminyltransferase [Oscillospiraceae bacterium]
MRKRVILTGGGTAGHVTPHLALIPRLKADGWDIHYIGTADGIERKLIAQIPGVEYHTVPSGKLRRYFDIKNLTDPFKVISGVGKAFALVGKIKPGIVFSKGGFVSVPVVYGAWMRRVPVVLHESDITPGLANRITAPFAKAVCATFPEAAKAIGPKGVYTGTPLRETLFEGSRKRGLALAGFNGTKPVLLMMGGSTGAASVNAALRESLPGLLPKFDILHIAGKGNMDASLNRTDGYRQFEYMDARLPDALAAADIMLSRAGANTLSEILALRIPSLLVPYPLSASRGDQVLNARSFEERGFAMVLEQERMTAKTLVMAIESLYDRREAIASKMRGEPVSNGIAGVIEQIEKYAL